jgi:AraC-like DNA-binding protein
VIALDRAGLTTGRAIRPPKTIPIPLLRRGVRGRVPDQHPVERLTNRESLVKRRGTIAVNTIELMRCAHAIPYIETARAARVRIDEDLGFASLPTMFRDVPAGFLPKAALFDCLRAVADREAFGDFGYQAFRRWRLSCMDRDVLASVRRGCTLRERLRSLSEICAVEDTQLCIRAQHEGDATRIVLSEGERPVEGFQYEEWMKVAVALGTIRDALGSRTQVLELTFQSRYRPSVGASAELGTARLVTHAPCTSIAIATALLDISIVNPVGQTDAGPASRIESVLRELNGGLASRLKLMLKGYLGEACPSIRLAASLVRTSVRSLQRDLARFGISYSEIVQQVRFEQATRMLSEERTKVIDIALSLGYEDASHFSRAFRRAAGMSPRQYRRASYLPARIPCTEPVPGAEWPERAPLPDQHALLRRARPQEATHARYWQS